MLIQTIGLGTTGRMLVPALVEFGIGLGMTNAQLTNIILSSVRRDDAGEASASSNMLRQVGTSVGVAIIGTVLASSLSSNVRTNIAGDASIPGIARAQIEKSTSNLSAGNVNAPTNAGSNANLSAAIKLDIDQGLVDASKSALKVALVFSVLGAICSLLIPSIRPESARESTKKPSGRTSHINGPNFDKSIRTLYSKGNHKIKENIGKNQLSPSSHPRRRPHFIYNSFKRSLIFDGFNCQKIRRLQLG